jgi:hypothetical protein
VSQRSKRNSLRNVVVKPVNSKLSLLGHGRFIRVYN